MPANGLRVNHYDFVALHSMRIIFLKGYCVLVRVEIIHNEFFSTVPGKNFDFSLQISQNRQKFLVSMEINV